MVQGSEHQPSEEFRIKIKALKSFGNTHDAIADYLKISRNTLEKYYRQELDEAVIEANEAVANCLYNKAVRNNDTAAQIFWLKTRGGWRSADGKAAMDATEKNTEELIKLRMQLDEKNKKDY